MLAARVAHERNVRLGEAVGYQIRLDNVSTAKTRIRFVTEGVLLRQMVGDPQLAGVTVLIFDEFHERHLYGDIALARALDIQRSIRPDLKIVVMSATLDTDLAGVPSATVQRIDFPRTHVPRRHRIFEARNDR